MQVKIVRQGRGSNLRIGIYGSEVERQQWLDYFYNCHATEVEVLITNEIQEFGYFHADENKLLNGLAARHEVKLINSGFSRTVKKFFPVRSQLRKAMKEEARLNAAIQLESFPVEMFDKWTAQNLNHEVYSAEIAA